VSKDYGKLGYLMKLLTPGLVFVDDGDLFADAIRFNVPAGVEVVVARGVLPDRGVTKLSELLTTPEAANLDAANAAIGPDTIAKFLLTSGSTGNPKAVINTQRMMCANQIMLRDTLAFLKDEPPVIIDWLPWNHTFGGNHNIGLTLFNGGSIFARSRRRSISTSPRAMKRCYPICVKMRRCVKNSSHGCMRCSSRALHCLPMSGTVSMSCR
jgi:feruloyl-CoA synthase